MECGQNPGFCRKQPPKGKMISFAYRAILPALKGLVITVNYELYDGIPLIVKWLQIDNKSNSELQHRPGGQ